MEDNKHLMDKLDLSRTREERFQVAWAHEKTRTENNDSRHSISLLAQAAFYAYVNNDGSAEDDEMKRLFSVDSTRLLPFPSPEKYAYTTSDTQVRLQVYAMRNADCDTNTAFVVAIRGSDNMENWIANSQG